jgi:hypothetical protein
MHRKLNNNGDAANITLFVIKTFLFYKTLHVSAHDRYQLFRRNENSKCLTTILLYI